MDSYDHSKLHGPAHPVLYNFSEEAEGYAIIRPTMVFGGGDLLLSNIAWALRRFPVFPVFGSGDYRVQPVNAEDLAAQALAAGFRNDSFVADAAGPETFTFEELPRLLAPAVNARVRLVHTMGFALTQLVGLLLRDVVWARDEIDGLIAEFIVFGSRNLIAKSH